MASRLLNDPVSVRGALRGTQRRRWLPHRFADGVLRRCRAGSYSRSPLRAIAGSGRLGALRLSHRVQHLPWPQSFCQDAAGECQRRSSAAADLPLLSAICLFCSRRASGQRLYHLLHAHARLAAAPLRRRSSMAASVTSQTGPTPSSDGGPAAMLATRRPLSARRSPRPRTCARCAAGTA